MQQQRAGHTKSRNGCLTCKIRRVKCDETVPYCRKCTESGRKCEGPVVRQFRFIHSRSVERKSEPPGTHKFRFVQTDPISEPNTAVQQPELSLLVPQHSQDERRAFHYFTHRAAPLFAGVVDDNFWQVLVPRLAQTYDFVWDTVVSISSLLEHVPYTSIEDTSGGTSLSKLTNPEHRQALKLYNRAIAKLRQLAEKAQVDESIVVLSYILFASVEFQQRNVKTGNDLVRRCCEILTENLTSPNRTTQISSAAEAVHQVVTPFVLRKAITIVTFGNGTSPQWATKSEVSNQPTAQPSTSVTLNDAREQFRNLVFDCYELVRLADFFPSVQADNQRKSWFMSRRQSLLDRFIQWKESFRDASSRWSVPNTDWIYSYLATYWAVCYISLAACISLRQTVFDNYMDHFQDIVEHAAICLNHSNQHASFQTLSDSDPGLIPFLYFCATKCRDPILRRRALHLMRQAPQQEDSWAFVAPYRVVAKVISIEEGDGQLSPSTRDRESQSTGLPPEERRFAYVSIVARRAPGGRQGQALELSRFEFASDGTRTLISDYAWLDDDQEG